MSTSFPTSLDNYATVPENQATSVQHRDRHQSIEDAMEAVQTKVGINNSLVTTSFDYRIRALENSALVGNIWTQNAVPVGAPDGSLLQVLLGPNQFLGRSSSGDVAAKTVSDFALTILDDADATAVRATISAQLADITLSQLAAFNTNGLMTQTAPDTFTGRTLTGTAGRITVTNGDGVAGNPTITIPTTLIDSGTYTPTITNSVNVSASAASQCQWKRVGNMVTVSGSVNITPTATGDTQFRVTLPVASNFAATSNAGGAGMDRQFPYAPVGVSADSALDVVLMQFNPTNLGIRAVTFTFSYLVI